jgi:uncharacterized protein (TIGR02996 family)
MPRYEKDTSKGVEAKEVRLDGMTVTTITHKANGKRSEKSSTYQTERMATSRFERAIEGFRKQGMVHASQRHRPAENAELERAIFERPEDEDARIVYGDWLLEQGDPRGELVAIQRQLGTKATKKLRDRERELLATYSSIWYGPLDEMLNLSARRPKVRSTWRLGFLDELELRLTDWKELQSKTVAAVASLHSARFLRALTLGSASTYTKAIAVLAKGWPKTLRALCINGQQWGEHTADPHRIGSLAAVCRAHPELEVLSLKLDETPFDVELPALRVLDLAWGHLDPNHLPGLAKRWPELHTLRLCIGPRSVDGVAALLDAKRFPKLTSIEVLDLQDPAATAVVEQRLRSSKLGRRLALVLDLKRAS